MEPQALSNTLLNTLKRMNPTAQIIDAHSEDFCSNLLINRTLWDEKGKNTQLKQNLTTTPHNHPPHKTIRTFSLECEDLVDYATIEAFLDLLQDRYGTKLLRIKAIIALRDNPYRPLILHGVQTFFHPPIRLSAWPKGIKQTRFVIIADGVEKEAIKNFSILF